ncbi:hypothetical protein D3C73_1203540 [compost metagenome]
MGVAMFLNIFINRIKCLIRDKENVFWVLLFPIALATLFKLAIPDIANLVSFKTINIAVVDN